MRTTPGHLKEDKPFPADLSRMGVVLLVYQCCHVVLRSSTSDLASSLFALYGASALVAAVGHWSCTLVPVLPVCWVVWGRDD